MPTAKGADWEKYKKEFADDEVEEKKITPLSDEDIQVLKTYGAAPYASALKKLEKQIKEKQTSVNDKIGVKESDTGLAPPHLWDVAADRQRMSEEQPLQVARCTKIIQDEKNSEKSKYVINVKQIAKFVVQLGERVSPTDIEEGMRVGVDRNKYQILLPLPPKIDASVTMMTVEEKPDVTYGDVGGCKEQVEKLREVVEMPLLSPERFVNLGIDPPKGALLYGPPGTGKTLCARAVANRTDATFIRVIGSELVQKYVGEGARMVRELFEMARTKKACIIFFDEIDAIGGARFDDGAGGDNEVQRTMLELITQLDGFDARGNIKVMFATNRPSTLDPALMRPGRIDRKIEFSLPDLEGRANILRIHAKSMSVDRDIRWELISRLCPNSTGAELRSVCTEAGMFAIRARRKVATEKDFLSAVDKVIKGNLKFNSTATYMQCHLDRGALGHQVSKTQHLHTERPIYGTMRRDLTALIAAVGLASASQTVFSIHDDIDAFPQYSIVFSPSSISSSEAADLLEPPKASNGADPAAIPLEYTRLILQSTPHLCSIPRPPTEERNLTSEAIHKASLALELSRANTHGWELLSPLGGSCLYYTSGWWSYKFCYNDSITQFHAAPPQPGRPQFPPVRDPRTPQFVLGRAKKIPGQDAKSHGKFYDDGSAEKAAAEGGSELELRGSQDDSDYYEDEIQGVLQDNGDNRYLAHKMKSGTLCDLTMRPREIEIQYHCGTTGTDRIAWIKEVTTCSYLMVVYTPRLCTDVAFQPQAPAETHEILCKPIIGEESTESSATDSAPQEPARSDEAEATSKNAADVLKSLAKENAKDKPLIIGGTVVGGGEYFPANDPPLLKPPPFWSANTRAKKPVMISKSDTKVAGGSGKGGNAAAKVPGVPDSEKLTASVNARLESDGEVAIEILAHGQGQSDDYHMMNEDDLRALGMSPTVVEGLAIKLRTAAGSNAWTLALVEGQGVDGREVRGVIDAAGIDVEDAKEWAWEEVEKLIFGQEVEDKAPGWKEREEKAKTTGTSGQGEGKAKGQQQQGDAKDEEEGSEEVYFKDEL
ncbi:hypothetical protein V494_03086 [Pseudogymnoascus sp. VKM F-4513 (FW-928)]|nr:hypothetical protein V494_03086 [Pseudogymnoascus sp. VKM F-4513 (FW-928)]